MTIEYYDKFSKVYDILSPKCYYHAARAFAVNQLSLQNGQTVLNLPCGTGQNFDYIQGYLCGSGQIIGIDLSSGMLQEAKKKVAKCGWENICLYQADARKIDRNWLMASSLGQTDVNAILCDLGLSGFPQWRQIIDNMLELLRPGGTFVIMDWYLPQPTLRASIIKWIGKGEVDRPLYQYLESKVTDFKVNTSFNRGGVFVATGIK